MTNLLPTVEDAMPAPMGGTLSEAEAGYARASRAHNTQRGYRSNWADFTGWCGHEHRQPLPADPETINGYIVALAAAGAKVTTIARRLSSIAYAHRIAGHPSPTEHPRVQLVWEGIRREHRAEPDRAKPLMPPALWDVLTMLPDTPSGHRDAAILLVGFVGALRRSELAAAHIEHLDDHPRGRVLRIPVSKTDQHGAGQLVVLPASGRPEHCPVTALDRWLGHLEPGPGPLFRPVRRSGFVMPGGMSTVAMANAVQRACAKAFGPDHGYSAHSLRSGFATYAAGRGASDRAIARQTRHRSMASLEAYIRHETAWVDNAATALDF